jgi:hypothetical protein
MLYQAQVIDQDTGEPIMYCHSVHKYDIDFFVYKYKRDNNNPRVTFCLFINDILYTTIRPIGKKNYETAEIDENGKEWLVF